MQGGPNAGGGALKIVSAGGGNFDFAALDFAAIDFSGAGSQTLMIEGFLGGSPVGTDQYTLANTANIPFTNWTTEAASVLAGKTISELDIELNAGNSPTTFARSIDNVVLKPVSAPVAESASLALLAAGLLGLGWFAGGRPDPFFSIHVSCAAAAPGSLISSCLRNAREIDGPPRP